MEATTHEAATIVEHERRQVDRANATGLQLRCVSRRKPVLALAPAPQRTL
jgi:hypothetical protein